MNQQLRYHLKILYMFILCSLVFINTSFEKNNESKPTYVAAFVDKLPNYKLNEHSFGKIQLKESIISPEYLTEKFPKTTIIKNLDSDKSIYYLLHNRSGNISIKMKNKDSNKVDVIKIENLNIRDTYKVKVGMNTNQVQKRRKKLELIRKNNKDYAYVSNSNIYYELENLDSKNELTISDNLIIKKLCWTNKPFLK